MTGRHSNHFIAERVEALAVMHLTRRADLRVRREVRDGDRAMDLIVEVVEEGRPLNWKRFGVYLQGTRSPVTLPDANSKLKISLGRFFHNYGEPSIPFCLFYFTMEDNRGYFTWVSQPVVDERGHPRLKYHREGANCVELDLEALDSIVDSVNVYYEALYSNAIDHV